MTRLREGGRIAAIAALVVAAHALVLTVVPLPQQAPATESFIEIVSVPLPARPEVPRPAPLRPPARPALTEPEAEPEAKPVIEADLPPPPVPVAGPVTEASEPDYRPLASGVTPPVVPAAEFQSRIRYPDRARRLAVQATVDLELSIDREGVVRRVVVVRDPGYGFADAAVQALEGLVCQPALLGGEPVAVRYRFPVRFTLR